MEEITRLTAADFDEAIDLMDMVFSKKSGPHDFAADAPLEYGPDDAKMQHLLAIKEDGRIRAVITLVPVDGIVCGQKIKICCIGGVCTHPRARNTGYMRKMLTTGMEDMRREGVQISVLGGDRQRYGYFGYEMGGMVCNIGFSKMNVKHALDAGRLSSMNLLPIEKDDAAYITYTKTLYDRQLMRRERTAEDFYLYLTASKRRPYIITENGRMLGYVCMDAAMENCHEIISDAPEDCVYMMGKVVEAQEKRIVSFYHIPFWDADMLRSVCRMCESTVIRHSNQWRIFDWAGVLPALMQLKSTLSPLADGHLIIGIEDSPNVEITVSNGKPYVSATKKPADVAFGQREAVTMLLSNTSAFYTAAYGGEIRRLLTSWFPIPVSWRKQDS